MQQQFKTHVRGIAALLMHNGQTRDPLNRYSKALKQITSKKDKTDADFEEISKLEFYAGIYLKDNRPSIPAFVIEASIINGAKRKKKGQQAKAGLFCVADAILIYEGPTDVGELYLNDRFRFTAPAKVSGRAVMRTRPKFEKWEADLEICYNDEIFNERDLVEFCRIAGRDIGFMDWRPKYGRFEVIG